MGENDGADAVDGGKINVEATNMIDDVAGSCTFERQSDESGGGIAAEENLPSVVCSPPLQHQAPRLPVLDEEKPLLIDQIVTKPAASIILTSPTIRPEINRSSPTQTPSPSTSDVLLVRPNSLTKHHPRMMSIDHTSIDLDAIDMANSAKWTASESSSPNNSKTNRKWSEFDESMISTNNNIYWANDRCNMNQGVINTDSISNSSTTSRTSSLMDLYVQSNDHRNASRVTNCTTTSINPSKPVASASSENSETSHAMNHVKSIPNAVKDNEKGDESIKNATTASNKDAIYIPSTRIPSTMHERANRIRLGICAMDKKARSKPMAEILSRLQSDCKLSWL